MNLRDALDAAADDLRQQGDPYEVAVMLASQAARYAADSNVGSAALIHDIFGTYAQRIHSYDGRDGLAEAEQANQEITEALADWEAGDRTDVSGFANRWFGRVGEVDTTWLDEPGTPLRKVRALGHLIRRRLRR